MGAGRRARPAHTHESRNMSARDESISNADFGRLRSLIYEQSGINLSAEKKTMLELRIKRRLRSLDLNSFAQYCDYLFGPHGQKEEIVHLLDVVSTNKTDFFREPEHFEYLVQKAIPELMARNQSGRPLLVWSAGCSTGEEPYTLAMVLNECGPTNSGFRFRVLATDISTTVLAKADRGVFSVEVVGPVPPDLNFMDADFGLSQKADVIFCRNVIIYFDRATQEQIIQKLAAQLVFGGYAFVGHSETLHDMDIPLAPVAPAIYRKREDAGN